MPFLFKRIVVKNCTSRLFPACWVLICCVRIPPAENIV